MRRARKEVAPGIQSYVPTAISMNVLQAGPLRVAREVLFVYMPGEAQPRTLRLRDQTEPLDGLFKEQMDSIDLSKCILLHEKKGELDPKKSLSYYSLEKQCQIQLVKASEYREGKIKRRPSKIKGKRRNLEVEEGNEIKQLNPLGLGRVKDLYQNDILKTKGVLITRRGESRGGRILNQDTELDDTVDRLYRMQPGNPFELMKELIDQKVETEQQLLESLKTCLNTQELRFTDTDEDVGRICCRKIDEFLSGQSEEYKRLIINRVKPLYALPLWTSDMFYDIVNGILLRNQELNNYQLYIKYFEEALKLIPSERLTVYRGFKQYRLPNHVPGDYVFWRTINSTSQSYEVARQFTTNRGTFFTIYAKQAKDIHKFSAYPQEKEYLLAPFTCYRIISYKAEPDKCVEVVMEETPSPRSTNTILWVADQLNPLLVIELEAAYEYSVLCVRSNSEALEVMEKFPWLFKENYLNLQVVTNGKQSRLSKEELQRLALSDKPILDATVELAGILDLKGYSDKLLAYVGNEIAQKELKKNLGRFEEAKKDRLKFKVTALEYELEVMKKLTLGIQSQQGSNRSSGIRKKKTCAGDCPIF